MPTDPFAPPPAQPTSRRFGDHGAARDAVFSNALDAVNGIGPVENTRYRIDMSDVGYGKQPQYSVLDHSNAVLDGRSLTHRMTGTVSLTDKASGTVVDRRRMTLAAVPYLTKQGVFVLDGSPMAVSTQLRLDPGVYTRRKQNGQSEAHVNFLPGGGVPHRVHLDPESGVFKMTVGQAELPAATLMHILGATDEELKSAWGEDLAKVNLKAAKDHHLDKYYEKFGPSGPVPTDPEEKKRAIAARLSAFKFDPWITRRTLGHPHETYDKAAALAVTKKLLDVAHGRQEPDDRDHPAYSSVWGPEHLIAERLARSRPAMNKILWQATNTGSLKRISPSFLSPNIRALFTKSGLGQMPEGTSAAEFMDHGSRITKVGEGGIGRSADSVPMSARSVNVGQMPFIDLVRTSESESVGVDLRTAFGTKVGSDKRIYAPLQTKSGRIVYKNPRDLADAVVAFPGWRANSDPLIPVVKKGKLSHAKREDVDYFVPSMEQTFSPMANMVPLKSASKPHRTSMGARMITQALPLQNAQSPLVRSGVPGQPGKSFEELFGRHMGTVFAPPHAGGVVTEMTPDAMKVRYDDGTQETHEMYNAAPSGRKTAYQTYPLVKPGDRFEAGQILAKSNFTDDRGHAAHGVNARIGFMPWKGSVTPDTMVLWYDAFDRPRYTPICEVDDNATRGISLDTESLDVNPSPMRKVWSHPSDNNVVCVKTGDGRKVRATTNHSFVVLGPDLRVQEAFGADLVPGSTFVPRAGFVDLPVVADSVEIDATAHRPAFNVALDQDFGFVCGLYAAEGNIGGGKRSDITVGDPLLRADLLARLSRLFPWVTPSVVVQQRALPSGKVGTSITVQVWDVRVARWLDRHCGHLANNKKVPDVAFGAPHSFRRGFVAGFWAGDGRVHVTKTGVCKDTDTMITSRRLRDGLGLLMASLGISTTHGEYNDDAYTYGVVYRLGVSTRDAHKIPQFAHTDKWDRLKKLISHYRDSGLADMVPATPAVKKSLRDLARRKYGCASKIYKRMNAGIETSKYVSRADVGDLVATDTTDATLRRLLTIAASSVEWELVESVTPTDYVDEVYDLDMGNRRTFLCLDTLIVHNSVYEDSLVVSKSLADRMTSHHVYSHQLAPDDNTTIGRTIHAAAFPGKHTLDVLKTIDESGVVKPGTEVKYGDPLILGVRKKEGGYARLSRSAKAGVSDASQTWDHDEPGRVVGVRQTPNGPVVQVETFKPTRDGDKVSGRHGNKGVVNVVEDHEMPIGADGKPLEVIISSLGTISRVNPSAIFEAALGKVAAKTGQPYVVHDFEDHQNVGKFVEDELAKHGESFTEDLTDPETGRKIPKVGVGNLYLMKLSHVAESKAKGRGLGGYDESGQPTRGQSGGALRASLGDTMALMSYGATNVLKDKHMGVGQANDAFWSAYMAGFPVPTAHTSSAFDRFLTELKAAGVNPVREGSRYKFMGLRAKDVDEMAEGRVVTNGETLDASRDNKPYPGGLHDENIFGAVDSKSAWAAIPLHEPVLNPVFEEPARRLLGLTESQFRDTIAGKHQLAGGRTGMSGLVEALKTFDVKDQIERARKDSRGVRKTARDVANRKLGYLKHMEATGGTPADWVWDKVPVMPPAFRPVTPGRNGAPAVVSDVNLLYRDTLEANNALKTLSTQVEDVGPERLNLYDAVKAVVGTGDPITAKNKERGVKGVLGKLLGDTGKQSYLQQKLLGTPIDLSGRGQVLPSPDLDLDELGLPEAIAWDVFHPFIVRRMVRGGVPRMEAAKRATERTEEAKRALLDEMKERPVLATRYPVLHRYGVIGFRGKLVPGSAILSNNLINKGMNLDHDGDTFTVSLPLSDKAVSEAYEKLLPSKNLFSPASFKATNYLPNMEFQGGLHAATAGDDKNHPVEFDTLADAKKAFKEGLINYSTRVRIKN